MAYCRVETADGYTVMSNYHLRDMRLSLKARGLLSQILSLPEKWDMTISGLSKINRECSDTIASIIKELEATGYITRYRERRKNGTYGEVFYDIRMKPRHFDEPKRNKSERVKPKQMSSAQLSKEKSNKEKENKELFNINQSILPDGIDKIDGYRAIILENIEYDLIVDQYNKAQPDVTEGISPMTILNKTFTDKEEAGKALLLACKQIKSKENLEIGSYKGFDMSLSYDSFAQEFHLELQREMSYTVTLGTSESGNILRIDNALDSIEKRIENSKEQLETLNEQLSTAKAELGKPFPQEAELTEKLARLAELNTLLNIDENAIENAAVAAEKKPDIPISADEVKPMRNVFPERKTSILDRIKEMQSAQAGNIPKEKTPTKDKTSEIS